MAEETHSLTKSIEQELGALALQVTERTKLTMKEALKLKVKEKKHKGEPMEDSTWKRTQRPYAERVKVETVCYCPECHDTYVDYLERGHVESSEAWRIDGCIVKTCYDCRNRVVRVPLHV
jgi:hypothetical protein